MSNERRSLIADTFAAHPSVDWLVVAPVGAGASWLMWGDRVDLTDGSRSAFLGGVATLAGLVLAAATFICTLTYQSTSQQVAYVRKHFGPELRRNWRAIFASILAAAVATLVAFLILDTRPEIAMSVGVFGLVTVVVRAARAHYWLSYTLFMHQVSDATEPPYVVQLPAERESA